jgi:DNA-binding NtrC family response regulator
MLDTTIPLATMAAFRSAFWPRDTRELANVIERAVILSAGPELKVPLADLQLTSPRNAARFTQHHWPATRSAS